MCACRFAWFHSCMNLFVHMRSHVMLSVFCGLMRPHFGGEVHTFFMQLTLEVTIKPMIIRLRLPWYLHLFRWYSWRA